MSSEEKRRETRVTAETSNDIDQLDQHEREERHREGKERNEVQELREREDVGDPGEVGEGRGNQEVDVPGLRSGDARDDGQARELGERVEEAPRLSDAPVRRKEAVVQEYTCGEKFAAGQGKFADGRTGTAFAFECPNCKARLARVTHYSEVLVYDRNLDGNDPRPALHAGPHRFDPPRYYKHRVTYDCGCVVTVETFDGNPEYPLECLEHWEPAVGVVDVTGKE